MPALAARPRHAARPRRRPGPAAARRALLAADHRLDDLRAQAIPGALDDTLRAA